MQFFCLLKSQTMIYQFNYSNVIFLKASLYLQLLGKNKEAVGQKEMQFKSKFKQIEKDVVWTLVQKIAARVDHH